MAWTAPSTKSTGTLVTAAIWNEQVKDNLAFLGDIHNHSGDAGDGAAIAGSLPPGAILMFDAACPSGWTRVSALDGKFVRGNAAYGGSGGADTHLHTGPNHTHVLYHTHTVTNTHTHTLNAHTHPISTHTHNYAAGSHLHSGGDGVSGNFTAYDVSGWISASLTGAGGGTGTSGGSGAGTSGTTDVAMSSVADDTNLGSTLPPYVDVIFCVKD